MPLTPGDEEKLAALNQAARNVTICFANLYKYEAEVRRGARDANDEFYGALKAEANSALSALRVLKAALDNKQLANLTNADIALLKQDAVRSLVEDIARAKHWTWNADQSRWEAPDGSHFSELGSPV